MQYGLWQIQKYLQQYRELVSKIVSKKFKESEKSKKLKNFKNPNLTQIMKPDPLGQKDFSQMSKKVDFLR